MTKAFCEDVFYGYIVKGDLLGAINYVKIFPDQADLYQRFICIFEREECLVYDLDSELNDILMVYQQYYRDVFYLGIDKEQAENMLKKRLTVLLDSIDNDADLCDIEEKVIAAAFRSRGLYFLGGRTGGYYGPYVWKTTETVAYNVELPDGVQDYSVKLLDGFIVRSWIDYLSFGRIGPGGWADGEGHINCVKASYDFNSESFKVSLLKHEAQHARDMKRNPNMTPEDLEYRAKLVELIYSEERNLLKQFIQQADISDKNNGHAIAADRIVKRYCEILSVKATDLADVSISQIQAVAKNVFAESSTL